ncbi:IclR family transcriptional regulator [Roseospira visakhapatnamensis]|uniref:IclR family acetate operon transcriptional repressor n=1 Tax=Roseospira visakhapatnamensis TaxID=390880 RepID=A0A7W6RG09_9PROT|nr:IclR family transcriptional regulator C-terminal domain-containing protein [Roseospira visakhapatnamensis]MBB4267344.1 IclR family acetate operon transcriptional repressor [Roseospira visakhapatnamensis]
MAARKTRTVARGAAVARPEERPEERRAGGVQSVRRAMAILTALSAAEDGLTLTEVAQAVGLAPSTAHRLLTTLQDERFARVDPGTGLWSVGVGAFSVGNGFLRGRDLVALARPDMRQLMYDSGETVNLAVAEEGEAVYLSQVECREMMRAFARPGSRVPLHCTGVGKALLAALDPGEAERLIAAHPPAPVTGRTLVSSAQLRSDLAATRARGFAIDDQEQAVGLRCVAAVIRDQHGEPLAAMSLSGPMARITDARLEALGTMVIRAADALTARLGGVSDRAPASPAADRSRTRVRPV